MNFERLFSVKFFLGILAGVGILVWFGGISLSKNIGERVEKASALVKEIQEMENPSPEKLNELLKITVISGVRG